MDYILQQPGSQDRSNMREGGLRKTRMGGWDLLVNKEGGEEWSETSITTNGK